MQKYTTLVYIGHGTQLVEVIKSAVLESSARDAGQIEMVNNIAEYYRLSFDKFLDPRRVTDISEGRFYYDVRAWLASEVRLEEFRLPMEAEFRFHTTAEQYREVENYFERYGRNEQAMGKILTRLWIVEMLRKPMNVGSTKPQK